MKQCQTIGAKKGANGKQSLKTEKWEMEGRQTIEKFKVVKIKGFAQFKQSPANVRLK